MEEEFCRLTLKVEVAQNMDSTKDILQQIDDSSQISFTQPDELKPQIPYNPHNSMIDFTVLPDREKLNNSPVFGSSDNSNRIPSCANLHVAYLSRAKNFKAAVRAAASLDLAKTPFENLVEFIAENPRILQEWGKSCVKHNLCFFQNRGAKSHFRKALNSYHIDIPPSLKASRYSRIQKVEPIPPELNNNLGQISLNGNNYTIYPITILTPHNDLNASAPPQPY